jgi:hypothetical protein
VSITNPGPDDRYEPDSTVVLRGRADDIPDGPLPDDALTWTVELHHNTHTHPYLPPTRGNDIELVIREGHVDPFEDEYWLGISLKGTDSHGLTGSVKQDFRPTLDTEITSTPKPTENVGDAAFAFRANDSTAGFACSMDGSPFVPCSSPASYSGLSAGNHTFVVMATDGAGNTDPSPARHTWAVDLPPETTIASGPSGTVASTDATFEFGSNEAPSSFVCSLDQADFGPCTSPMSYSGLWEGAHTFATTATDAAGNADASPATRTWTVDLTPPETTITSGPSGTVLTSDATFEFGSDEPSSTFECSLDQSAFVSCTSPRAYSGLPEGAHTFAVMAADIAGNTDPSPASRTWTAQPPPAVPDSTGSAEKEEEPGPPEAPTILAGEGDRFQLAAEFPLEWTGAGQRHDVAYREADSSRGFSEERALLIDTEASRALFVGEMGHTYCFRARAKDDTGRYSPYSPSACTAVPLGHQAFRPVNRDDEPSKPWSETRGARDALGGRYRSTEHGAMLVSDFRIDPGLEVALLMARCPGCGRVQIYWGQRPSHLIEVVSLRSRTRIPVSLVPLTLPAGGPPSGKRLFVRIASDGGQPVIVKGLGLARNP